MGAIVLTAIVILVSMIYFMFIVPDQKREALILASKPTVDAYIAKYGATNRFYCENGVLIGESINEYGEVRRNIQHTTDFTTSVPVRCDVVSQTLTTSEIVGGGL